MWIHGLSGSCVLSCVNNLNVWFLYIHSHYTALASVITEQLVCVNVCVCVCVCVCSISFNTSIMQDNAYMHAWTKWFKGDLPTSLYIYILIRETDTLSLINPALICLPGHELDFPTVFSSRLKIGKEKKKLILSFHLSFPTRPVNLPLSLLITAVYRPRGQQPLLSLGTSHPRAVTRSRAAFRSHEKGCRCEPFAHLQFAHMVLLQGLTQMSLLISVLLFCTNIYTPVYQYIRACLGVGNQSWMVKILLEVYMFRSTFRIWIKKC